MNTTDLMYIDTTVVDSDSVESVVPTVAQNLASSVFVNNHEIEVLVIDYEIQPSEHMFRDTFATVFRDLQGNAVNPTDVPWLNALYKKENVSFDGNLSGVEYGVFRIRSDNHNFMTGVKGDFIIYFEDKVVIIPKSFGKLFIK